MPDDERRGYRISDIYQGGYSSLAPPSDSYVTAESLGITTDPRSANIIQEVSSKLSSGVKQIEVEAVSPEIFDSIPKQHFKEVNRMAKLTGINISMHGPVMNVSGIDPRSGFSETNRESAERKVKQTMQRGHELNPDGNIIINFHSAEEIPGSQFLPPSKRKEGDKYKRLIVVNKESGKLIALEHEEQYYPGHHKPISITPEQRINMINNTEWDNSINQSIFQKEQAEKIIEENYPLIAGRLKDMQEGRIKPEDIPNYLTEPQRRAYNHVANATAYLSDIQKNLASLYDKACKYGTEEDKRHLMALSEKYGEIIKKGDIPAQLSAVTLLTEGLKQTNPELYEPIENFASEQSSKTFGNAAWETYKEFKENSPVLVIENPPAGFGLSTGEDIKNIVEKSREQFRRNAVKNGLSEKEAERQAEKLIGATLDLGHINMLRKYGYKEEEIVKETEKVAGFVKHIHLSDNFGYEHTELPIGMGNVPFKEMMKKLGEKGVDAKKIIEAGAWWQHFRTAPFEETLEAMGSPIYGMKMATYWNQAQGFYQGYSSGMEGAWLPQTNYETFGTSFSRLPKELGGQMPGAQGGRMSGRPME